MERRLIWVLALFLWVSSVELLGQRGSFLNQLRIGFGAGANTAQIIDLEPFNVFEDLTGNVYENRYSGMLQNFGNQYFVQAEWVRRNWVVLLKPGTYTYRFRKSSEVIFTGETVEQSTPYLLRYFNLPLELRYNLDLRRFRPYAGIHGGYNHLLGSHDPSNRTFIRPRFTAGVAAGTYIDLRYVILDFHVGYHTGVHNIARKDRRFASGSGSTFAQDDLLLNDLQINLSLLFSLQKQRNYSNVECFYE